MFVMNKSQGSGPQLARRAQSRWPQTQASARSLGHPLSDAFGPVKLVSQAAKGDRKRRSTAQ